MMNTIRVTPRQPGIYAKNISQVHRFSKPCVSPMEANPLSRTSVSLGANSPSGLPCLPILKSRRPLHVCLAGGNGMMENNNEDLPWKSLEKATENFKGQSIEDVLLEQIRKGEYYENGGNGTKPPGRGGGGGGGSPGGSEDGRFAGMSDETLQVVLATIGFILMYICVNDGVELAKLARDYIKYLSGGNQSVRLQRVMYKWARFFKNMTEKKEVDNDSSEKAPARWFKPDYFRDIVRNHMRSASNE